MQLFVIAAIACLLLSGKVMVPERVVCGESCWPHQQSKHPAEITIRTSGGDFQRAAKNRVTPAYPPGVKVSGPVVIEVTTNESGDVESARVIYGEPLLASSALDAVKQWKWEPTLVRKGPAKVVGLITIVFNHDGSVSTDPVPELIAVAKEEQAFDVFRPGEATELLARLKQTPETDMLVLSTSGAPVEVVEARLRRLERHPQTTGEDDTTPSTMEPYAMSATVGVRNASDKKLKGALLQFVEASANNTFFVYVKAPPNITWMNPRQTRDITIRLISLPYDPRNLTVQVAGVLFEDGEKWGAWEQQYPHQPYPPVSKNTQPVDARPIPLNRPRPDYTEEARAAHLSGIVRLELMVGADGIPRVTDILNRLPAGLTARGVLAAVAMRFKPAMCNGTPVPYYTAIEVEFNLR
jgi:TonB family protein